MRLWVRSWWFVVVVSAWYCSFVLFMCSTLRFNIVLFFCFDSVVKLCLGERGMLVWFDILGDVG